MSGSNSGAITVKARCRLLMVNNSTKIIGKLGQYEEFCLVCAESTLFVHTPFFCTEQNKVTMTQ